MTRGYQLAHLKSYSFLIDNILREHGGLPHVRPLAVYLSTCAKQEEGVILSLWDFPIERPPSCFGHELWTWTCNWTRAC